MKGLVRISKEKTIQWRGPRHSVYHRTLRTEKLLCPSRSQKSALTTDTEINAKRNNIIPELITFRNAKAKAKVKFGVKHLCKHECERSSVPININTSESDNIFLGELISL